MSTVVEDRTALDEARLQKIEFRAMGSQMMAAVESDDPAATRLLSELPQRFAAWEQTLSRFKDDSELSLLNRADGEPVKVSETLWNVLQVALMAARYTEGLVTPTLLNALEAAGYNATFDEIKKRKEINPGDLQSTTDNSSRPRGCPAHQPTTGTWQQIKTNPRTRTVKLPRGVRLDFGGIGKGWAADEAVKLLAKYGPALVDAGGDIAVSGAATRSVDWPVGVDTPSAPDPQPATDERSQAHRPEPAKPGDLLDLLAISSGGVATSGIDYRRWQQGGRWRHHIIDPRTGLPAETDVLTVTVVAPTACVAEIAAKAVLLLGSKEGLAWLDNRPSLAGLLVLEDGSVLRSTRFSNYVWSNN